MKKVLSIAVVLAVSSVSTTPFLTAAPIANSAQQLGAKPAAISTPYKTEVEWALGEMVSDIAEMAALAARKPRPAPVPAPAGVTLWNLDQLIPLASELFGPMPAKTVAESSLPPTYPRLTDLTAATLVIASATVSAALMQNMRSAQAHEAAALVLGAFGLREAADDMSDVRWSLNRMTAHLAVAAALRRGESSPSLDGRLARVVLFALSGRHSSALAAQTLLVTGPPDPALNAWSRALRMRITKDWRLLPGPANATRLEKLEYFRARRATLRGHVRAGEDLARMGEQPAADFSRIVECYAWGVEDGQDLVRQALALELVELADVHKLVRSRPLPVDMPADVINVRASRLVVDGSPQVLPWGAWAEFSQRHVGMHIGEIDQLFRKTLGLATTADELKVPLDAQFGHFALFPIAASKRTRGEGTEADLTYIAKAVALAARAPELVTYDFWMFLELGARMEFVTQSMPLHRTWFAPPSAAVPYEAGIRARDALGGVSLPALQLLVDESNADLFLLSAALRPGPLNKPLVDSILVNLRGRADYDLHAVESAVAWARDPAQKIEWRRRGCALVMADCITLAMLMAGAGDDDSAAAQFELAFRDPSVDRVTMANNSWWLVSYYERRGRLDRAQDLAEQAASTGSGRGLITLARFYERRGRIADAEELFRRNAGRYLKSSDQLVGFYYRQAVAAHNAAYQERWNGALHSLFPNGLQPVPATMPAQPAKGVFISKDSYESQKVRLQAGDIIVALDGWLVESKEQYDAIVMFSDATVKRKITAWRGILFTAEALPYMEMELDTYPLRGWIR